MHLAFTLLQLFGLYIHAWVCLDRGIFESKSGCLHLLGFGLGGKVVSQGLNLLPFWRTELGDTHLVHSSSADT